MSDTLKNATEFKSSMYFGLLMSIFLKGFVIYIVYHDIQY